MRELAKHAEYIRVASGPVKKYPLQQMRSCNAWAGPQKTVGVPKLVGAVGA